MYEDVKTKTNKGDNKEFCIQMYHLYVFSIYTMVSISNLHC